MTRLLGMMHTDIIVQWRNRLYAIGIGLSVLIALGLLAAFEPRLIGFAMPQIFMFSIGGTALLYILGLMIFEKDEGTLYALLVTPLRHSEYLWSKLLTLALLAFVEAFVVLGLTVGFSGYQLGWVILGALLLAPIWTLIGMILVVRYDSITDALLPMVGFAVILQLPALHFSGLFVSDLWYLVPTTAPALLIRGGWLPLETWQIAYGIAYPLLVIALLYRWALRAFYTHIVLKG